MLLGIKAISNIKDLGGQVELTNFKTSIINGVEKNYNFGLHSLTGADLLAPPNTDLICFVSDADNFNIIQNPKLRTTISSLSKLEDYNLYIDINGDLKGFTIEHMKAKNNIQCKQGSVENIKLAFENKGLYSEIEIK